MMKLLKTALVATSFASLVAATGCIQQDGPPAGIARAIPTADQVEIKLPAQARMLGQVADYYKVTRDVTRTLNGGSAWVLVLIHAIVQQPVTSINGNVYTWGPGSGALDPADYKLDVTANADGTFDYVLSGKSKTVANSQFEAIIDGHADPTPGDLKGNGDFLVDFDASRRVNPIDSGDAKGQITVHYDLAERHLDLHAMTVDANGLPATADYGYNQTLDGGGDMVFKISADMGGTTASENATIRSRWQSDGQGRGDARLDGGDLGAAQAIASECWNNLFARVYYTDNANFQATEGDVSACAFGTVDLPPAM